MQAAENENRLKLAKLAQTALAQAHAEGLSLPQAVVRVVAEIQCIDPTVDAFHLVWGILK